MQITPTQKRATAWALIALLAVFALRSLGPVLTPFIVASVLAYVLTPVIDRLCVLARGHLPRVIAVIIVELALLVALALIVPLVLRVLYKELSLTREHFPGVFDDH